MVRVALAANSTWNLENFRTGVISELVRQGHDIVTISPDSRGLRVAGEAIPHRRCEMDRSGMNPIDDALYFARLLRTLKQERPDVLFSYTIKPNIYGSLACRLLGIRAVPNVSGLGTAFLGFSHLRRLVIVMYRSAFKHANPVFFQNEEDCSLFVSQKIVQQSQARVLPGSGVDLRRFAPSELPKSATFLLIARLLGDKGVREYVAAARNFRRENPTAEFLLLGDLDSENRTAINPDELEAWIREGVVEHLGSTQDVRPYIRRAAAVVLPSYREGLARTLLEAAAMGRPLIATDVPGCRQVVREGDTGFLCQPKDSESLAGALSRFCTLSQNERSRMGARARKMVEREYDEERVIEAYLGAVDCRR